MKNKEQAEINKEINIELTQVELKANITLIDNILSASDINIENDREKQDLLQLKNFILQTISIGLLLNFKAGKENVINIKKIVADLIRQLSTNTPETISHLKQKETNKKVEEAIKNIFEGMSKEDPFWILLKKTIEKMMLKGLDNNALYTMAGHYLKSQMYEEWISSEGIRIEAFHRFSRSLDPILDISLERFKELSAKYKLDNAKSLKAFSDTMRKWVKEEEKNDIQRKLYKKIQLSPRQKVFLSTYLSFIALPIFFATIYFQLGMPINIIAGALALYSIVHIPLVYWRSGIPTVVFSDENTLTNETAKKEAEKHTQLKFASLNRIVKIENHQQKNKGFKKTERQKEYLNKENIETEHDDCIIRNKRGDIIQLPEYEVLETKLKIKNTPEKKIESNLRKEKKEICVKDDKEIEKDNITTLNFLNRKKNKYFISESFSDDSKRTIYIKIDREKIIKENNVSSDHEKILDALIDEAKRGCFKKLAGHRNLYETRDSTRFRLFGESKKKIVNIEGKKPLEIEVRKFNGFGPGH